jgi:adenine-specific DNA-methyltransferase
MDNVEKVAMTSVDIEAEQKEKLLDLFPEVLSEGKIDFDRLRATLGDLVDDRPERYSFTWPGKQDAIKLLQTPSRATLKPNRGESVDFDTTPERFYRRGESGGSEASLPGLLWPGEADLHRPPL